MAKWRQHLPRSLLWVLGGVAATVVVLFVLWLGPWLFTRHPGSDLTDAETLKAQNDVRTTLVQTVAGLAVAGGAIITYRSFHQTRIEQDRSYGLSQSHQVTDTYAKAVEQLGHDEAPVRLGALYSLERLAHDHPSLRQTVVDVFCAYLRMPYIPPPDRSRDAAAVLATEEPSPGRGQKQATAQVPRHDAAQELQVRQTAQRLLVNHLRGPRDISSPDANIQRVLASFEESFWPDISLDLTGATLVDLELSGLTIVEGLFNKAAFLGFAAFGGASFSDGAWFRSATFSGHALFPRATFSNGAHFAAATFSGHALFQEASFSGDADFDYATFSRGASFDKADFANDVMFDGTKVLALDDPHLNDGGYWRVWPDGWTVRPDAYDPTRGTLVQEQEK